MKAAFIFFIVVSLTFNILAFTAPYLKSTGNEDLSTLNYLVFEKVCHQLPTRSFSFFGEKSGVCARCQGIYLATFFGAIYFWAFRWQKDVVSAKWVVASIVPLAVDGTTQLVGLRQSNNVLRIITGFFFGFVIPLYFIPAIDQVFSDLHAYFIKEGK